MAKVSLCVDIDQEIYDYLAASGMNLQDVLLRAITQIVEEAKREADNSAASRADKTPKEIRLEASMRRYQSGGKF